jgi:hypothetical protein
MLYLATVFICLCAAFVVLAWQIAVAELKISKALGQKKKK